MTDRRMDQQTDGWNVILGCRFAWTRLKKISLLINDYITSFYYSVSIWTRELIQSQFDSVASMSDLVKSYKLLSTMWYRAWWRFKVVVYENEIEQRSHLNGFSLVWLVWWILNPLLFVNAIGQSLQLNGFSPVWILLCNF